MTKMQLSVKNVDKEIFKEFKAESTRVGLPVGGALSLAMQLWLQRKRKKPKMSILDYKPWSWGKGTERVSEEIDKILYEDDDPNRR